MEDKKLRIIYYVLMTFFALLIVWRVYQWSQGADKLSGIGSPLGFILLFAAMLVGKRNAALYYGLLGAAAISVIASLVLMFIY